MPSCQGRSPAETLALDAYVKLVRASETITAKVRETIMTFGITDAQFAVLEALHHLGPLRASVLARKLLRSSANMTTVIDNLEKAGYVERGRCPADRRGVHLVLTAAGSELIARMFPAVAASITQHMSNLTPMEQKDIAQLARKLGRSLSPSETSPE